jgi:hypothetical protein
MAERFSYRALTLPVDASSTLLPGLCGTILVSDELYHHTTALIQRCLSNDCVAVSAVAKISVFLRRLLSLPLDRIDFFVIPDLGNR